MTETVSQISALQAAAYRARRKFDHDEAKRLYSEGWSLKDLATHFGVSVRGMEGAVDPVARKQINESARRANTMPCDDCGVGCFTNRYSQRRRKDRIVCRRCSGLRLREETLRRRLDEVVAMRAALVAGKEALDA